jgi:hypothetical protein
LRSQQKTRESDDPKKKSRHCTCTEKEGYHLTCVCVSVCFEQQMSATIAIVIRGNERGEAVSQSRLWEAWWSECRNKSRIVLWLYAPKGARASPFFEQRRLQCGDDYEKLPYPFDYQECVREVLRQKDTAADMVYWVAGNDVPLRSAAHMLAAPVSHSLWCPAVTKFHLAFYNYLGDGRYDQLNVATARVYREISPLPLPLVCASSAVGVPSSAASSSSSTSSLVSLAPVPSTGSCRDACEPASLSLRTLAPSPGAIKASEARDDESARDAQQDLIDGYFVSHGNWLHLTRTHAALFAEFDLGAFAPLHVLQRELEREVDATMASVLSRDTHNRGNAHQHWSGRDDAGARASADVADHGDGGETKEGGGDAERDPTAAMNVHVMMRHTSLLLEGESKSGAKAGLIPAFEVMTCLLLSGAQPGDFRSWKANDCWYATGDETPHHRVVWQSFTQQSMVWSSVDDSLVLYTLLQALVASQTDTESLFIGDVTASVDFEADDIKPWHSLSARLIRNIQGADDDDDDDDDDSGGDDDDGDNVEEEDVLEDETHEGDCDGDAERKLESFAAKKGDAIEGGDLGAKGPVKGSDGEEQGNATPVQSRKHKRPRAADSEAAPDLDGAASHGRRKSDARDRKVASPKKHKRADDARATSNKPSLPTIKTESKPKASGTVATTTKAPSLASSSTIKTESTPKAAATAASASITTTRKASPVQSSPTIGIESIPKAGAASSATAKKAPVKPKGGHEHETVTARIKP